MLTQYLAGRREDTARSYEHRREAYANFIIGFHQKWNKITEQEEMGYPDGEPGDYLKPSCDRLIPIQIFGTLEATDLAEKTMGALRCGDIDSVNDTLERLLIQVRHDLSIPGRRKIKKSKKHP